MQLYGHYLAIAITKVYNCYNFSAPGYISCIDKAICVAIASYIVELKNIIGNSDKVVYNKHFMVFSMLLYTRYLIYNLAKSYFKSIYKAISYYNDLIMFSEMN